MTPVRETLRSERFLGQNIDSDLMVALTRVRGLGALAAILTALPGQPLWLIAFGTDAEGSHGLAALLLTELLGALSVVRHRPTSSRKRGCCCLRTGGRRDAEARWARVKR